MLVWTWAGFKNIVLLKANVVKWRIKKTTARVAQTEPAAKGVGMHCTGTLANDCSLQGLKVSLEVVSNLIYLSRLTETHCAQQNDYLDRAAQVIAEIAHHRIIA
jgi:hypothetical protein